MIFEVKEIARNRPKCKCRLLADVHEKMCVSSDDVSIYVRSIRNRVISRPFGIFSCRFNIKARI